jgi:integration host factor subunit alpha
MVEAFFDEVRSTLESGDGVKLSGFGTFELRDKPQRPGRNPKTGEDVPISARRVVTFHASGKLKRAVAHSMTTFNSERTHSERTESLASKPFFNGLARLSYPAGAGVRAQDCFPIMTASVKSVLVFKVALK